MRICHAFLFFSIKFAGGTSDLMFKICKAQEKVGLKPIVLTGSHKFDAELAKGLPKTEFHIVKSYLDKFGFSLMPGLISRINREMKSYDVVHMHAFRTFQNVVLYYFCKKYGVPYVMDAHGAVPYYTRKPVLKRLFDFVIGRKILREAKCLVAETNVGVDEYLQIDPSLDRNKIVVLSPPFDTDEFLQLPQRGAFREMYKIPSEKKVIMFLGRVHHIKGNDFLIKGFAELTKVRDDVTLVIVGPDDGHMDECKALTKELGVEDKVIFTGFLGGEHKNSALIDADVVVQMSRHEQGAWAPFEAVLCGTPIVVSSHTGAGEDVKRIDAGYLAEFDNVGDLAQKLSHVLENFDEAKEKTLAAKNYIESNLSMNARIHEYTEVYLSGSKAEAKAA